MELKVTEITILRTEGTSLDHMVFIFIDECVDVS